MAQTAIQTTSYAEVSVSPVPSPTYHAMVQTSSPVSSLSQAVREPAQPSPRTASLTSLLLELLPNTAYERSLVTEEPPSPASTVPAEEEEPSPASVRTQLFAFGADSESEASPVDAASPPTSPWVHHTSDEEITRWSDGTSDRTKSASPSLRSLQSHSDTRSEPDSDPVGGSVAAITEELRLQLVAQRIVNPGHQPPQDHLSDIQDLDEELGDDVVELHLKIRARDRVIEDLDDERQAFEDAVEQLERDKQNLRVQRRYAEKTRDFFQKLSSSSSTSSSSSGPTSVTSSSTSAASGWSSTEGQGRWIRQTWLAGLSPQLASAEKLFELGDLQKTLRDITKTVFDSRRKLSRATVLRAQLLTAVTLGEAGDPLRALANIEDALKIALAYQPPLVEIVSEANFHRGRSLLGLDRPAEASLCFALAASTPGSLRAAALVNFEEAEAQRKERPVEEGRWVPEGFSTTNPTPPGGLIEWEHAWG